MLLGNGNLKESGELPGGRHFSVWVDPFPKPCYLFALVSRAAAAALAAQGPALAAQVWLRRSADAAGLGTGTMSSAAAPGLRWRLGHGGAAEGVRLRVRLRVAVVVVVVAVAVLQVAGTLYKKEREYVTGSGRKVALRIFVAEKDLGKVDHALDSLVKSMKWDEEVRRWGGCVFWGGVLPPRWARGTRKRRRRWVGGGRGVWTRTCCAAGAVGGKGSWQSKHAVRAWAPRLFRRCRVALPGCPSLQTFGLEYDLDLFNIVAVDDFNMGAVQAAV